MTNLRLVAGIALCSATLAASGLAASAAAPRFVAPPYHGQPYTGVKYIGNGWWNDNGIVYHTPHYMLTRSGARLHAHPATSNAVYYGGPVLLVPHSYLILWGYNEKKKKAKTTDPDGLAALLETYLSNNGGSGYNNIYTQYYSGKGASLTYISNPTGQLMGVWDDKAKGDAPPLHPTDGQIAAEAVKSLSVFGYDPNGSYIVATEHGHNSSGFGSEWCGYHSDTVSGGNLVSYTNLPYVPDAGGNCGADIITPPSDETAADEGVTIVEGHEYGESITDPKPGTGWYNNSWGEIGDVCAWMNIQNDPYGSYSFTAQPMWSNASSSCVHSYK